MSRKKIQPRITTKDIPDKNDDKQFPTGISSTILAIQNRWHEITEGGESMLSPRQFCKNTQFADTYREVQALYPRREKINAENENSLVRVVRRLINQERNIDFVDMRVFAQLVGLPTGLFLLFTQLNSDERRFVGDQVEARDSALQLIKGVRRVIDLTEHLIKNAPTDRPVFREFFDEEGKEHIANIEVLKMWSEAFAGKMGTDCSSGGVSGLPNADKQDRTDAPATAARGDAKIE